MRTRTVARVHRGLENFLERALNGAGPASLNFHVTLLSPPATVSLRDRGSALRNTNSQTPSERTEIR